jgi:microcystin-dependent protein
MADPFVAEIRIFPFNFAPKGWAFCDGQLLPLSQNTALFSLLGTTYGGDGRSNFALPNLQGSAPMHTGQGPGLSLHDLGETGDRTPLACSSPKCPPTATPSAPTVTSPTSSQPKSGPLSRPLPERLRLPDNDQSEPGLSRPQALASAGGSQPHNNLMPYLTFTFYTALQGVFPSRG